MCPITGINFVARGEAVRHLGILLSDNLEAMRQPNFQKVIGNVIGMRQHWAGQGLSILGRGYVAKQVMGNSIGYQSALLTPMPQQANTICSVINGFMVTGTAEEAARGVGMPSLTVRALPLKDGGLNAPDVKLHIKSLQAKAVARFLGPKRLIWSVFFDAQFEDHSPHLGAFLPLSCAPLTQQAGRAALRPRAKSFIQAFRSTYPHRVMDPSILEYHSIMTERLFENRQVKLDGQPIHPVGRFSSLFFGPQPVTQVQHLRGRQDELARQVVQCLPAAWQAALTAPEPACQWECNQDESLVRSRSTDSTPAQLYRVHQDGGLGDPVTELQQARQTWQPCLVVDIKQHTTQHTASCQPKLYLQGPWAKVTVDPRSWGHGSRSIAQFTVKHATARAVQLQAKAKIRGYSIGAAVRPPVWDIQELEQRWVARCEARGSAFPSPPTSQSSQQSDHSSQRSTAWASWMEPSPARPSPQERATARAEQSQQERRHTLQAQHLDDITDIAAPQPSHDTAQRKRVWADLHGPMVQRKTRGFGHKLYHAKLPCGALCVHNISTAHSTDAHCTHDGCTACTETLTHLFLECPAVMPVITWLCDTWEAISGERPPANAAVILGDNHSGWSPGGQRERALWTVLRLTTLQLVWARRCRRNFEQELFSAAGVVAMVVYTVRDQMLCEWRRVKEDVTDMAGVCKTWYRGRSPILTEREFERRWCLGGVLGQVRDGELVLKLCRSHPVASP